MGRKQKWVLVFAAIMGFVAMGSFVSPSMLCAGDLEPSAPPGSTMKTLDQIPPTWSQKLSPASKRFELVMDGGAVLDKETGLVWEQSPDTTSRDWTSAWSHCYQREVANRKGWRFPTIEELASLVDNDNSAPSLPTDHPFSIEPGSAFWSSTTDFNDTNKAWLVGISNGSVSPGIKGNYADVWCVRGGHGHYAY